MNAFRGIEGPVRQKKVRRFNPDGGYLQSYSFASFSESQILNLFNLCAGQGLDVELTSELGRHELVITDSRGETRIDRWGFSVSEEQPGLLTNPYLSESYEGEIISPWESAVIATAIDRNLTLPEAVEDPDIVTKFGGFPASIITARGRRVYELMRAGTTQYQRGALVLTHVTNVSNRYALNVSEINENRIYTHADFLAEALSPDLWIFPLPGRLSYKATSFYNRNNPGEKDHYLWGWLKSVSPETSCSNQRVEIETTFKLDQFSLDIYKPAT